MAQDMQKSHVIDGYLTINYCNDDKPGHAYFLTHIETELSIEDLDKVICMTAPTIYTSAVNAYILKNYFKCDRHITPIEFGKTYQIYTPLNTMFIFTCIQSYYNCGSMVLIGRGDFGTFIYTGFSPINLESLMSVSIIKGIVQQRALTRLYLDSTYYKIGRKFFSVQEFIKLILQFFQSKKNQFYVHVPIFGLEDILAQVAAGLKEKMVVDEKRMDLIKFLGLEDNFTLNKAEGRLHLISQGIMKRKNDGFSSQLVFIKVVNDYSEKGNSYICHGKIHFFTVFPHTTNQDCAEIINTMKPKEFIPIHCQFNLNGNRAIAGMKGSVQTNEEPSCSAAVRRKTVNGKSPIKRSPDSVMTEGGVKLKKRKHSEANKNESISLSKNIDDANYEYYAPLKVRKRKFARRKRRKTKNQIDNIKTGFSKLKKIRSQLRVMTRKKGFAHKSSGNTFMDPQITGDIIRNNEAQSSSTVLENEEQTDSLPLSLNVKDQKLLRTNFATVETTGYNPTHSLVEISENVNIDLTKNNVIGAKLDDYFVSDEHTYALPAVGSDIVEDSSAQVQDDKVTNSDCESGRQSIVSKSPERQMEQDSEVIIQDCDIEDAVLEVSGADTDCDNNVGLNENYSDSSGKHLASWNKYDIPLESVASEATEEECITPSEHAIEMVQNEEEDDSDDCIIQENSSPDIIELSDSSNDGLELHSKEGTNVNSNSNHSSELNTQPTPTSAIEVCKPTLSCAFNNDTLRKDSGQELNPSGSTQKLVYLAKSLTRVPISLSSSPVIKRVFGNAIVKNRPSLILQKCPNSAENPSSLSNINNFSTNPRIVFLKTSQNAKGLLFKKVTQTFTPRLQSPKVISPSISKALQCQTSKRCIPILPKLSASSSGDETSSTIAVLKTISKQVKIDSLVKMNQVESANDNCSFSSIMSAKRTNESNDLFVEPSNIDKQFDIHSQIEKANDKDRTGSLARPMDSDSHSTEDCTSNQGYCSQNLEDVNKMFPSAEKDDTVMSAKLKIKNLAELVTNPSYLRAMEPQAHEISHPALNLPIAPVCDAKSALSCDENIDDVNDLDFCPPDYNSLLRGEVVDNSSTHEMDKFSRSKSSGCSISPPNLTEYDNISPENGCPESLALSPPTLIAEVEKPDPPSQPAEIQLVDSENRNPNTSQEATKKIRKRKKSVWMKVTKKKMCRRKYWMNNSSNHPTVINDSKDEKSDNVKSRGRSTWSISENPELNNPIVYKDVKEFLDNQSRNHVDSRLLSKFNIDESYVTMVPGFKDTPYKYKSSKKCYVCHQDREEDVYMDGILIGKFINYKVKNKNICNRERPNTKSCVLPTLKPFYENISAILPEKLSTTFEDESCDKPFSVENKESLPSSPVCRERGESNDTQSTPNSTIVTSQEFKQKCKNSAYLELLDKQNLSAYLSKNVAENIFTIVAKVVNNDKITDKPVDITQTEHSGDINKDSVLSLTSDNLENPLETSFSVNESAIDCPDSTISSHLTNNLKGDSVELSASSSNVAEHPLQLSESRPKRNSNQSLLYSSLKQLKRNKRGKKVSNEAELSENCESSTDITPKKKKKKCRPISREVANLRNFLSGKSIIVKTLTSPERDEPEECSTNQLDRDLSFLAKELFDGRVSTKVNKLLTPKK